MKKTVCVLIFILMFPCLSEGQVHILKLRSSRHTDFSRIVLEGPDEDIKKAIVNQKAQSILVTVPDSDFELKEEKAVITYRKTDRNAVMFFPGHYRGLKVFSLSHPSRLVIDVYKTGRRGGMTFPIAPREKAEERLKSKLVIIDPGHGGYESGLVRDNFREKNVVMDIARKLQVLINRESSRSLLTRGSDQFMGQSERVKMANDKNADIFISLHVSSQGGIVLYVPVITEQASEIVKPYLSNIGQEEHLNETMTLLRAMKEAVIADFGDHMLSVKPLPFSFLSKIEAAALLIEIPSFEDAVYDEKFETQVAATIYKGLYIYEEIHTR